MIEKNRTMKVYTLPVSGTEAGDPRRADRITQNVKTKREDGVLREGGGYDDQLTEWENETIARNSHLSRLKPTPRTRRKAARVDLRSKPRYELTPRCPSSEMKTS